MRCDVIPYIPMSISMCIVRYFTPSLAVCVCEFNSSIELATTRYMSPRNKAKNAETTLNPHISCFYAMFGS